MTTISPSDPTARERPLAGQVLLGYVAPSSCCRDHEVYVWPADQQEAQFGLEVAVTGLRGALQRGDGTASHRWLRAAEQELQRLAVLLPRCPGGCDRDGVVRSGIQEVHGVLRAEDKLCPVCAPAHLTRLCAGLDEEGL